MTFKIDFLSLMTKVSLNNGNDTKSDIFPWDIFKSDSISFFSSKYIKLKQRNKIKHFFMAHIQIWHHIFFYQNILKYFNDFQNQNVSILWLKWTQKIKTKQNQTFFHGTYSNLTPYIFFIKIFWSISMTFKIKMWTQKIKMKQNQTFFHETYSNLKPFFIKTF